MKKSIKITSALLATSLIVSPISGMINQYDNVAKAYNKNHNNILTPQEIKEIEPLLQAIYNMPDYLEYASGKEINEYFKKFKIKTNFYNENIGETSDSISIITPRASFWGCVGSLSWLIGSTAVSGVKIFKIKKYMQELGGVTNAVKLMWGASFTKEKILAAGGALAGLGAEILGIKGVKDNCFS